MNHREQHIADLRKRSRDLTDLADLLEQNASLPIGPTYAPFVPAHLPDPSAPAQYEPPATDRFGYASLADHLAHAVSKVIDS